MKRRYFLTASCLGAGGLMVDSLAQGCKAPDVKNAAKSFRISDLAPKPPLGWNSFDSYGVYLYHEAAMANIKALAEKLKPHGYEYFVIDGGWHGEFELVPGTMYPQEKHAEKVNINEFGIFQPSKTYFPQGFKPLVDYAHSLGLKFGVHLMRGIPKKAVELNLPIKNTRYRAADIADKERICVWNGQNYGVDASKPGAQEWYNSVIEQLAAWEMDFVKVDDLTPYPDELVLVANAIENCGRKMVFSLSPGGGLYKADLPYYRRTNMLRITKDIWDRKSDIDKGFDAWKVYQGIAHEGFWPDLDMIPFGQLQLQCPEKYATGEKNALLAGEGYARQSRLTSAQMRTFITMRALSASPLFVGGDLPTMDDYSLSLLTNQEMLACNQNGECGINVFDKGGIEVWITQQKDCKGKGWIGIFNRNAETKSLELKREELGLTRFVKNYQLVADVGAFDLNNIWAGTKEVLGDSNYKVTLRPTMFALFDIKN